MNSVFRSIWTGVGSPAPSAAARAATGGPVSPRRPRAGKEVLLVSSSSGRWISAQGLANRRADRRRGRPPTGSLGRRRRSKPAKLAKPRMGSFFGAQNLRQRPARCRAKPMVLRAEAVADVANDFPEANRRERIWVSPSKAAELVDNAQLKSLLAKF